MRCWLCAVAFLGLRPSPPAAHQLKLCHSETAGRTQREATPRERFASSQSNRQQSKMVRGLTSDSDDSDAPPPRPVAKKKPKRRFSSADPLATSESEDESPPPRPVARKKKKPAPAPEVKREAVMVLQELVRRCGGAVKQPPKSRRRPRRRPKKDNSLKRALAKGRAADAWAGGL